MTMAPEMGKLTYADGTVRSYDLPYEDPFFVYLCVCRKKGPWAWIVRRFRPDLRFEVTEEVWEILPPHQRERIDRA